MLAACAQRDPRPQVFVAASLHGAVSAVVEELGLEASIGTAASSTLARQIEHGADAAVFISANTEWMDYLAERKLLVEDTRVALVSNTLVWACRDKPMSLGAKGRIAMGDPAHVPAG